MFDEGAFAFGVTSEQYLALPVKSGGLSLARGLQLKFLLYDCTYVKKKKILRE